VSSYLNVALLINGGKAGIIHARLVQKRHEFGVSFSMVMNLFNRAQGHNKSINETLKTGR